MKISDEIIQEALDAWNLKFPAPFHEEMQAMLSAVLPKLMVKVKPLEWEEYGDSFISGEYRVHENEDSDKEKFPVVLSMSEDFLGVFVNESSAIECAQADYERRMLEGLEIVKVAVDVAAVRRQALEEAAEVAEKYDGMPCGAATGWPKDELQHYMTGQQDASSSVAYGIRALSAEPARRV